jgi:hypothetical protein
MDELHNDKEQSKAIRKEAQAIAKENKEVEGLIEKFKTAMDTRNYPEAYTIVCKLLERPLSDRDRATLTALKTKLEAASLYAQETYRPSQPSSNIGCIIVGVIVVIIIILVAFSSCGSSGSTDESQQTSSVVEDVVEDNVVAEETPAPNAGLTEKDLPKSGKTWYLGKKDEKAENKAQVKSGSYGSIYITVPDDGENYYVLAKYSVNSGDYVPTKAILIRSGGKEELRLPDWDNTNYELYYASGVTWYGRTHLFGDETQYSKADTIFTPDDIGREQSWEVELVKQIGGNLSTSSADAEDFQ